MENGFIDEKYECPFCGEEIRIWVGGKESGHTEGFININHFCDTGLNIEYFEEGNDIEAAKKCLVKFEKPL